MRPAVNPIKLKILILPLLLGAALALGSCARTIGYGLVLWGGQDGPVATGQILRIRQESQIQGTYVFRLPGSKELAELPTWRIRLFAGRDEALQGAEEYAPFADVYAYSQRDGLPIRAEADPEARRVYKLAEGQLVKVLSRGDQPVKIGNYEDYWYLVLTEDGFQGYCFGYYLPVFRSSGQPKAEVEALMARDPMLEALLGTEWRPEYFQEMADSGRIDLLTFGPQFGFFVDAEKKQIHLAAGKRSFTYRYEQVENVGSNRYVFEGSAIASGGIRVNMQSERRIVVTFPVGDLVQSAVFIDFSGDIEEIVKAEKERRQRLLDSFISRGRVLVSSAYGDIYLEEAMRFRWQDYGRLGAQIFLRKVSGSGVVDFPYHLSGALAASFDGVVTFRFNEYEAGEGTSFLYSFDSSGVRFEYVRPQGIDELEVVRRDSSPLVIYFRFGRS